MKTETLANPGANPDNPCPCAQAVSYAHCCGPAHGGIMAPTAAALMRSRYSAYVLGNTAYLLKTWAPQTRPQQLDLTTPPQPRWLGLRLLRQVEQDDQAEVEFVARFRMGGRIRVLHEVSRFVRVDGCWLYVDGTFR